MQLSGQSNWAILGSLFLDRLSNSSSLSLALFLKLGFLLKGTPLGWRLSNINTPSHQSTSPSLCLTFTLPVYFSLSFSLFVFHFAFTPPSYSLPWRFTFCPSLLCLFVSHLRVKIPSTISLLWSLTEHIFTPRYPQSHFPLTTLLFFFF